MEKRVFLPIGCTKQMKVQVVIDGVLSYKGEVDEAPEDIKRLKYSAVDMETDPITYYVLSELN